MLRSTLCLASLVLLCATAAAQQERPEEEDNVVLTGPNVCLESKVVNKTIDVTYLQSMKVKKYEWCVKIPPRCPKWKTELVVKTKQREISRVVNSHHCCTGYERVGARCEPVCEQACLRGTCVEPDTCSCEPGYSGATCEEVGCPGGNWGANCAHVCPCENGGRCEAHSGQCLCPPGFRGQHCQDPCDRDHYGLECARECKCEPGYTCNHVTGDCLPCDRGTWGEHCLEQCTCERNGTALCYHENGNCFCKSNHYGRHCELFCPFGYVDGLCHKEPLAQGSCSCASDLYRCDANLGCVCRDGFDCDGGGQFIDFQQLQSTAQAEDAASHAKSVSIVATVLLLALFITILFVLYYRRRMRRMQEDLKHRSVLYIENSVLTPEHRRGAGADLVVTNADPLPNETVVTAMNGGGAIVAASPAAAAARAAAMQNNLGLAGCSRPEKNVNIDRMKLGLDEDEADASGCGPSTSDCQQQDGACALPERPEVAEAQLPVDVNIFQQVTSPSKEKDNTKLADLYKKCNKTNVNIVINNTSQGENPGFEAEAEDDEDDETNLKKYAQNYGGAEGGN